MSYRLRNTTVTNLASYLIEETSEHTFNLPTPSSALAIGAHPDDIEFGCGGTLSKWANEGCEIFCLILTDGSKGSWAGSTDPTALASLRESEARAAANTISEGAKAYFLRWPDGELESSLRQRWQVAYHIRMLKPQVVLGHDPWKRYRLHPDHRNAGFLAVDSVVAARDPLFFPEQQFGPHRPLAMLLWEADAPDHAEDISATIVQKAEALRCHESQFESTMGISDSAQESTWQDFIRRLQERHISVGAKHDLPSAEEFKLLRRL